MGKLAYIIKSFRHYFMANLLVALGVAISTAVITGGLIIGDSITYSLEQTTHYRLGKTTHAISSNGRFFRQEIANEMQGGLDVAPAFISEAVAVAGGGEKRANSVQVVGVDGSFEKIAGSNFYSGLKKNEVIISQNLAEKLEVTVGNSLLFRVKKDGLVPHNAPFVSDGETHVSYRATIKAIATENKLGRFSLKNAQAAPYNVFMPIGRVNELMGFEGKANTLLIHSELDESQLLQIFQEAWKPADANLVERETGNREYEIYSERVFIEDAISHNLGKVPGADMILTYFVNSIGKEGNTGVKTPYSFVSTLPNDVLNENQIIINQWLANDLKARKGDTLKLAYFTMGPLRKLLNDSSLFVVKDIKPMEGKFADGSLMPSLPGMSDAGDCDEWEAGIPIDLELIRDKDEDYWDTYKGVPKAFISQSVAHKLWANRFGNYTSIRFDGQSFNKEKLESFFGEHIHPTSLGFFADPVKKRGLTAAQNGVDFSQLFIGLSFFILAAAIILSILLYLLHLESRYTQIGTLDTLGFKHAQIRSLFTIEGLFISICGALLGSGLAITYTELVFSALNGLWVDIVRTNVLFIYIKPATLLLGFIISILISVGVFTWAVNKKLKQQASNVQRKITQQEKKWVAGFKKGIAILFLGLSVLVVSWQLALSEIQNAGMFFMAGGLMLISLLLIFHGFLFSNPHLKKHLFNISYLTRNNLKRNRGRSFSIVILFALATFLVVSTGANKQDIFSKAHEKTSGTGSFLFFVKSTVPVLFDLNDPQKRLEEGLPGGFKAVQFRKVDGDDASCLNLNRITNPAILGADPTHLEGHFSFVKGSEELNLQTPWQSLNQDLGNVTPAIADQTVIQWGLGLKIGDTLFYQNEIGDTLKLKLIGGLAPSIFQGYVIIGNQHFLENYPSSSGSSVFLIDGDEKQKQVISEGLGLNFRDYGWEAVEAPQRLAEFYSVTNTYLSIFLALGALGLILGTIGLAVILSRSILERKDEIALMQAIGFKNIQVFKIIVMEYSFLLAAGIFIGLLAAVLATLPSILSPNTDVSLQTILLLIAIIISNGLLWIALLTKTSLNNKELIANLKRE